MTMIANYLVNKTSVMHTCPECVKVSIDNPVRQERKSRYVTSNKMQVEWNFKTSFF